MENKGNNIFERINNWIRNSVMLKMVTIGFLILILLIPESMIEDVIYERSSTRDQVVKELNGKWGNAQTIAGPILTIPYREYVEMDDKMVAIKKLAHFLPAEIDIVGSVNPQDRYRGIYRTVLYNTELSIKGKFEQPDFSKLNIDSANVLWEEAKIAVGVTDMRGIQNRIMFKWDGHNNNMHPGVENAEMISSGVHTRVGVHPGSTESYADLGKKKHYDFSFSLVVNGSRFLNFVPIGAQTNVDIKSIWADPKFDGAFIPDHRTVNDSGFVANWEIINLNRNYPQQWKGKAYSIMKSAFGVSLLLPVDEYLKTLRSAKYASLIVLLTFLIFFFIEITGSKRIHPLQYILVGSALVLFYTLLLSISEHFGFDSAYLISSILIIGLIGGYSYFIFANRVIAILLSGGLAMIYGFLFVILNSQDYALLMGSLGLFVILAAVMYATRHVNWFKPKKYWNTPPD